MFFFNNCKLVFKKNFKVYKLNNDSLNPKIGPNKPVPGFTKGVSNIGENKINSKLEESRKNPDDKKKLDLLISEVKTGLWSNLKIGFEELNYENIYLYLNKVWNISNTILKDKIKILIDIITSEI